MKNAKKEVFKKVALVLLAILCVGTISSANISAKEITSSKALFYGVNSFLNH